MRSPLPPIVLALLLSAGACRAERLLHPAFTPDAAESRVKLGSATDVLYVLNGRVLTRDDSTGVPAAVRALDPASISSIEVLKGASAKNAYGARGASGVVVITTKTAR